MSERISFWRLVRRLKWDLQDPGVRKYYGFWLIWQLPGAFGDQLRARYLSSRMKSAGTKFRVLAGCRFRSIENLEVGDNVQIGFDNFLQALGGLRIGNDVRTAPGVKIWSVNHQYGDADAPINEQGQTQKPVVIGNNVFIGSNAFIMPGVTLPDGCIVSAGAVVGAKVYRPYSMLAGNPARVIGFRGGKEPSADETPGAPHATTTLAAPAEE